MKFCGNCGKELMEGALFCTGCGNRIGASEKNCLIKVVRLKKVFGCAIPFDVLIDGVLVGSLSNGKSLDYYVTQGSHVVTLRAIEKDNNLNVMFNETNKNVQIEFCVKLGVLTGTPDIKNVTYF